MEISVNHQFGTLEIFADEFSSPLSGAFEAGWKSFPAGDPVPGIHAGVPSNILAAGGSCPVCFFRYRDGSVSRPLENFQGVSRVGWKCTVVHPACSYSSRAGGVARLSFLGFFQPFLASFPVEFLGDSTVWKFVSIPAGKTSSHFRRTYDCRGGK